ncbi:MAG: TetR/AcrR family transcriptional regulator [Candidatus Binatia bacterium]
MSSSSAAMLKIPPRPTRRTRAKRGGTKPTVEARLLAATERLLSQGHSFAMLSIEQLAAEAGMARATFYLHFRDKGELVARLMDYFTQELTESFGTWVQNANIAERKDVRAAVSGMVETFKAHQAIVVAVRDTMPHDKVVEVLFEKMMETISAMAQRSLGTVKRQGRSRPGATEDVADTLAWIVALYCTYCMDKREGVSVERVAKALGYICESAIFADEAKS